jgi:hypothetical protein
MIDKLKHYFKAYDQSKECFETSDGLLFHVKTDADAHASTLSDKKVKTHKRTVVELVSRAQDEKAKRKAGETSTESEKEEEEEGLADLTEEDMANGMSLMRESETTTHEETSSTTEDAAPASAETSAPASDAVAPGKAKKGKKA